MKKELSITLKVDAKTGQVTAAKNSFDDLDRKVSATNNNTSNLKSTLMGLAGATVVVMGISKAFELAVGQAQSFLDTGSRFEQHTNVLSSFYVGQEKLNEALDMARHFSQEFNVSIDETADAMKLMKINGIDASMDSLEKYGNVAKGSGKTIAEFVEAVADAFMGENERLKAFGVKASVQGEKVAYAWTDSMGKARSVLIDSNQEMIKSTLETIYTEKYVNQMAKYAGSWTGFIQGIGTDYENFQIEVMNDGLLTHIQAVAESFTRQWLTSFGDSKEAAKDFSAYMSEQVDNMARGVAFLMDTWTGIKMVWAGLKVAFWGVVVGIGESINWVGDAWDTLSVGMQNAWKTTVDGVGEAFYGVTNFILEQINRVINGVMSLGNDVLGLVGIDPIEPIRLSAGQYLSTIEKAVKSTDKLVNFEYSNNALADAVHDVAFAYDELENRSAQSFTEKALARMAESTKKVTEAKKEDITKTKEAKKEVAELLEKYSGKLPEAIKKGSTAQSAQNALLKEAKQLERERVKEAKALAKESAKVAKEWETVQDGQKKAFEDYSKNRNEAYKEYLRIIGDFDALEALENKEKVLELKPYLNKEDLAEVEKKLAFLSRTPNFYDGIADAFNYDRNVKLKTYMDELGAVLGGIAGNALQSITADFAQSGDINQAFRNFEESGALRDGLKNSGNPYAMALGFGSELISGALTEPIVDMSTTIKEDNTSIIDSLSLLNNVEYQNLEHTKSMRKSLESMDNQFGLIAKGLFSGTGLTATDGIFEGINNHDTFGVTGLVAEIPILGDIFSGAIQSFFGSTSSEIEQAGLQFGEQTVASFLEGVDVRQYANIKNTSKSLFGLVSSTSYSQQFSEAPQELKNQFADALQYGYETIITAGTALGLNDRNRLEFIANNSLIDIGDIDLFNKSPEEAKEELSRVFGNVMGGLAEDVVPQVEAFQRTGEEYLTALIRVSSGYEQAGEALRRMGVDVVNFQDIINKNGDVDLETVRSSLLREETFRTREESSWETPWGTTLDTSNYVDTLTGIGGIVENFTGSMNELVDTYSTLVDFQFQLQNIGVSVTEVTQSMIDGAGDLNALTTAQNSFISNFYTDLEQSELEISAMNREFEALNLTMPNSKDEFRALIESITDEELYGQAILLSDGFSSMRDTINELNQQIETFNVDTQTQDFLDWKSLLNLEGLEAQQAQYQIATRKFNEAMGGLNVDNVNIDNYTDMLSQFATADNVKEWEALGQQLQNLTSLEQGLVDTRDKLEEDRIKALEEEQKALENLLNSISNSKTEFSDFFKTFSMSDLEKVSYEIDNASKKLNLTGVTVSNFSNILNNATTENINDYNTLGSLLQQQFKLQQELEEDRIKALEEEQKALENLLNSISNSKTEFSDFFKTFSMSDLEKVSYEIDNASKKLNLTGVTVSNFSNILNNATTENINDYNTLGSLLQQQFKLQQELEEDRIKALEEERNAIVALRSTIQGTMQNILETQINDIRTDHSNRSSSINSLATSRSNYIPEETVNSIDIYNAIGAWSLEANDTIENSINTWNTQQLNQLKKIDDEKRAAHENELKRLQDAENLRVKNYNLVIDSKNEEIKLNNALADTITSLKQDVYSSFSDLYSVQSDIAESNFYNNVENKDYDNISSSFNSFANSVQNSSLSSMEQFIKLAYANSAVQNLDAPAKQTELEHIDATTVKIADYVSTLTQNEAQINSNTVAMYEALIKQNEENLPSVQFEIQQLFEQNKSFFDDSSDFYKFLERGATELTFTEKMEEQKELWKTFNNDAKIFNQKNIASLEKIDLSFNSYATRVDSNIGKNQSSIGDLERKLETLIKKQEEANSLNKQLIEEQKKAIVLAKETAKNTNAYVAVEEEV